MIAKLPNVEYYLDSALDEDQILEFDPDRLVIATGAEWRRDGVGRWLDEAIAGWDSPHVVTPDTVLTGANLSGRVVVYDDEHYYMGGSIAEKLRLDGLDVTLVTPANEVSTWTRHTEEQYRIQQRLMSIGVQLETGTTLAAIEADHVIAESIYTEEPRELGANNVVMVTARTPNDDLYHQLSERIASERIGDCLAPGTIATAVYSGHRYARELDEPATTPVAFLRDSRAVS